MPFYIFFFFFAQMISGDKNSNISGVLIKISNVKFSFWLSYSGRFNQASRLERVTVKISRLKKREKKKRVLSNKKLNSIDPSLRNAKQNLIWKLRSVNLRRLPQRKKWSDFGNARSLRPKLTFWTVFKNFQTAKLKNRQPGKECERSKIGNVGGGVW